MGIVKKFKTFFNFGESYSDTENPFNVQKFFFRKQNNLTIFDVGAYTGEITKIYRHIFPHAIIYCFEPAPDSFQKLKKLSTDGSIKPHQIAVSDCIGRTTLHINRDPTCHSFFPRPGKGVKYYPEKAENIGKIAVDIITIDQFCNTEKISHIDILKLDVEGAEIKALSGASKNLSEHAISIIYTEVMFTPHYEGGCLFYELSSFLKRYDYELFNFYHLKRAKNGQLRWGNAIFLSPQARAKIEGGTTL